MNQTSNRREFLSQAAGLSSLALLSNTGLAASDKRKTNIVYIMADDLGYGDLSCYGCRDIRTKHIDDLANQGVRFTNFYANHPECTPTRTALLTGRYQHRFGGLECAIGIGNVGRYDDAIRLRAENELGLPTQAVTIAELLKKEGYSTALYGKWHLGYEEKFNPTNHGFDDFFGVIGGNCDYFHHTEPQGLHVLYKNKKEVHRDGYMTDLITEESVDFINRSKEDPFFLYVSYTAPHSPYQGPDDKTGEPVPQDEWNEGTRATYIEMVERMDYGIGQIVATLEKNGLADNTLVIFASDNGANRKGRNYPFSGYKGGLFEGGIRVPCVVRWPGHIPAGTESGHMCITMDLSLSMMRAANVVIPPDKEFDGADILKQVEEQQPITERTLFWRARRGERTWKAVRDVSLKYIYRRDGEKVTEYLFNLEKDPMEKKNLIDQQPNDVIRLKRLLTNWEAEVTPMR